MLPRSWMPSTAGDLTRLGRPNDGGYVVTSRSIKQASLILSMGLSDDWSFEEAFLARSAGRAICFDHSVTKGFWRWHVFNNVRARNFKNALRFREYRRFFSNGRAEHRLLKIGYDGPGEISLASILQDVPDADIFLKVDIEGGEYRILDDVVRHQDRFTGIVMEFHDVDLHRDRIDKFISSLRRHKIVALHPNNIGGVDSVGDPIVIEITFTRDDLFRPAENEVDYSMPNNPAAAELVVRYAEGRPSK
jgi:hypothetical protein